MLNLPVASAVPVPNTTPVALTTVTLLPASALPERMLPARLTLRSFGASGAIKSTVSVRLEELPLTLPAASVAFAVNT